MISTMDLMYVSTSRLRKYPNFMLTHASQIIEYYLLNTEYPYFYGHPTTNTKSYAKEGWDGGR